MVLVALGLARFVLSRRERGGQRAVGLEVAAAVLVSSTVTRTAETPMSSVAVPARSRCSDLDAVGWVPVGLIVPFGEGVAGDLDVDRQAALGWPTTSSGRGRRWPARRRCTCPGRQVERCGVGPVVAGPAEVQRRRCGSTPASTLVPQVPSEARFSRVDAVAQGDLDVVQALVVGRRARERDRTARRHRDAERWPSAGSSRRAW